MVRKLVVLWLLGGVVLGYGTAIVELAGGSGSHCHGSDQVHPEP